MDVTRESFSYFRINQTIPASVSIIPSKKNNQCGKTFHSQIVKNIPPASNDITKRIIDIENKTSILFILISHPY